MPSPRVQFLALRPLKRRFGVVARSNALSAPTGFESVANRCFGERHRLQRVPLNDRFSKAATTAARLTSATSSWSVSYRHQPGPSASGRDCGVHSCAGELSFDAGASPAKGSFQQPSGIHSPGHQRTVTNGRFSSGKKDSLSLLTLRSPMATSNSSTCGHPKLLQAGRSKYRWFEVFGLGRAAQGVGAGFGSFDQLELGKRSASGRRHRPGSGGQATNPAGAVHRLVLWAQVACPRRARVRRLLEGLHGLVLGGCNAAGAHDRGAAVRWSGR